MTRFGLLMLGLLLTAEAAADTLWMARSPQSFPETMLELQTTIADHGYTVSRVQRVDIGLTESGFETDRYRIVFFGRPDEVRTLSAKYPQLIPYLPLQVTIFAEEQETLLVTIDPVLFQGLVEDPAVQPIFARWRQDTQSILDRLRSPR